MERPKNKYRNNDWLKVFDENMTGIIIIKGWYKRTGKYKVLRYTIDRNENKVITVTDEYYALHEIESLIKLNTYEVLYWRRRIKECVKNGY